MEDPPSCLTAISKDILVLVEGFSNIIAMDLPSKGLSSSGADLFKFFLFNFLDFASSIIDLNSSEDKSFIDRSTALSSTVTSMSCVTAKINYEKCAKVQMICMENLKGIRQEMGASSNQDAGAVGVYDEGEGTDEEKYNREMKKPSETEDEYYDRVYENEIMNQTEYPDFMVKVRNYIMTLSNN